MSRSTIIALLALGLCSCGNSAPATTPSNRTTLTSTPVLTEPPPYTADNGPIGAAEWFVPSDGTAIEIVPQNGTGVSKFSVTIPGTRLLMATVATIGGTEYLLMGAIDSNEQFTLHRMHDSNGDEVVDGATLTAVFNSNSEKVYGYSLSVQGDKWYLLDRRCQDVRIALDTTSDGFANSWQATPFAKSQDHAVLLDTRHLLSPETGTGVDAFATLQEPADVEPARVECRDTDADNVADSVTSVAARSVVPNVYGRLFSGQTTVRVQAEFGDGETVQIYDVDTAGAPDTLLGSVQLTDDQFVSVPLSRSLVLAEEIAVKFASTGAEIEFFEVGEDEPQYLKISKVNLPVGQVNTVDVEGYNLTSTTTYTLETKDGQSLTITPTFNSSTSVTLSIPLIGVASLGYATIRPVDNGEVLDLLQVLICQ